MGGFLNERIEASFCIAQRRRTEFLCSEKEGTARGTRGRFELCIGITFRNPTLVTTSPAAGPQRARGAGLGLEVTERVPSDDLVPQPRKQTPTHHTPSVFLFFVWAQGPQRVFLFRRGEGRPW